MMEIYARKNQGEIMQIARVRYIGHPENSHFGFQTSLFGEKAWECNMNMPIFNSEGEARHWIRNENKWTLLEAEEVSKLSDEIIYAGFPKYKFIDMQYEILTAPLTKEQIIKNPGNNISVVIEVHLSDMINRNLEGFLDFLEEQVVEEGFPMEINYTLVGISDNNTVLLLVSAYVEIEPD